MPLPPLPEPGSAWARFVGLCRGSITTGLFFSTLIMANVAQTLSLVARPFSGRGFRKINRFMANCWWGACTLYAKHINGSQVQFSGDVVPEEENAVVILNHQQMADIPVLFNLAWAKKRLGDMKWYVKDIIKYFPGVGWGLLFLDSLFIKRDWTTDRKKIHRTFETLLKYRMPFWVINFAEGTRVKPEKITRSQAFAKKIGLKPLQHVLIPRTKGFVVTIESLRERAEAVYDVTIAYVDGVPTLWQWIKGYVHKTHLHVRRFAMEELPQESEALARWITDRFEEKDRLLEHFYTHGAFPSSLCPADEKAD